MPARNAPPATAAERRPRKQSERRAESEEAMLEAAATLFARQGYLKTTLTDIGQAAGYSGALVTQRFGSKLGVLTALVARFRRIVTDRYVSSSDDSQFRYLTLSVFLERYFDGISRHEPYAQAVHTLMAETLGPLLEAAPLFRDYNKWFLAILQGTIVESQSKGEVAADRDAASLALRMLTCLRGSIFLWEIDPKEFSLPTLANAARELAADWRAVGE